MSSPAEQQPTPSSRWWVRLCQWLIRFLLFLWVTVVLGLALNIDATWPTTKGFDPKGTPLESIMQHLSLALACGGVLLVLTIAAGMLGRQDTPSVAHPSEAVPTEQSRAALIRLLRNEYRRQLAESLQSNLVLLRIPYRILCNGT